MASHGITWYDMASHGMTWHHMASHGITWHGITWHHMASRGMASHGTTKKAACKTGLKSTLSGALAKTTVSDTELQQYTAQAAKGTVATKMEACMATVGADSSKASGCSTSAKTALAKALGKGTDGSALNSTEFNSYVNEAAKHRLSETMKGCVSAANGNKTKRDACVTNTAKATLRASLGKVNTRRADAVQLSEVQMKRRALMLTLCSPSPYLELEVYGMIEEASASSIKEKQRQSQFTISPPLLAFFSDTDAPYMHTLSLSVAGKDKSLCRCGHPFSCRDDRMRKERQRGDASHTLLHARCDVMACDAMQCDGMASHTLLHALPFQFSSTHLDYDLDAKR